MAVAYPDIIGEYVDNPERYETAGVQYTGYFDPTSVAPEQVSNFYLFLQNTLNVPLAVTIKADIPQTGGLFGGGRPMLKVVEPIVPLKLASGEAGLLTWPVTTNEQVKAGEHALNIEMKVAGENRGQRIRPAQSQSKLDTALIDSPVGLNIVGILGATFTAKVVKKATFLLKVAGPSSPPERAPKLNPKYETIWSEDKAESLNQALQEVNSRQSKFNKELTPEGIFTTLYAESVNRFADAGLPLRIGEAITLAKILTFSCQYFLSRPDHPNALLVPMWEQALEAQADTTYPLEVIRSIGYFHLLKLALTLSFGLVAQATGRQPWPLNERQAVTQYIVDNIEAGQQMDPEFLYLPLLMAGTYISNKIKLEGENPKHSLALIKKAREARRDIFLDEDMMTAGQIFNQILKKALA
ncbi:MAG: hypothetical protein U0401_36715 [Anaerolineae bacterium]